MSKAKKHSLEELIQTVITLRQRKAAVFLIELALINEGLTRERANTILLWAERYIERTDNERQTAESGIR